MQLTQAAHEVLSSEEIGFVKTWSNSLDDTWGKLTLLEINPVDSRQCKIFSCQAWKSNKSIIDKKVTTCLDEQGNWKKME